MLRNFVITLFSTLVVATVNIFSKDKVPIDGKYLKKAGLLFCAAMAIVCLIDYVFGID
jgi:hypothetical protein